MEGSVKVRIAYCDDKQKGVALLAALLRSAQQSEMGSVPIPISSKRLELE